MFGDFLPLGLSPYPSPQAYLLLNTPVGRMLLDTARSVLATRYTMRPVGGESQQALIDRTALLFVQQFGDKWEGPISAETVDGSNLQTIVNFVSPMSDHKSATDILLGEGSAKEKKILIFGSIAVAAIVFAIFVLGKKKTAEAAPLHLGEGI